ncbi:hypothetical protein DGG96_13650 [Legionella qingyii]|uniref:Uncharacterized protein n=1 Tax=Legionella qingyii TaxID=2184757 RepID=A0A317U1W1_9GAMM|nr:hypothetical protein [Legionella qingyii]PWY55215.1 hypothetical protein DGG96_13650 [Legionella qingyii]RUR25362.1 hypothetical protein ELY20_02580 [Legionella qingyii]RUR28527.1 hypothetical protein ELY16_03430 [Legionella qingyii]
MISFFNKENRWRATMQVANGLALTMAAYNLFSNPETVWENGFEIAMLALNVVTFSSNDNALSSIGNAALNFTSLGTVYAGATSGCTSNSLPVSLGNAFLHMTNAVTSICYRYEPNEENTSETPAKTM